MTRYRTPQGDVVDEDDLYDYVEAEFTSGDFSSWLDDTYDWLNIDDFEISPTEILMAMGDFESCHEECIYAIIEDQGGEYPRLEDLGFEEVVDEYDSDSLRSAVSGVRSKGGAAARKVRAKAKVVKPASKPKANSATVPTSASRRGGEELMYSYYDRNGRRRLGEAEEVYSATPSSDFEEAYAEFINDFVEEPYIMRNSYSPSEVFREWSEADFERSADKWFFESLRDSENLAYLESISIRLVTKDDIDELFETQFGERRRFFKENKPLARRPPTPVERARQSSKGRTSSNSTRSKSKAKAKTKRRC